MALRPLACAEAAEPLWSECIIQLYLEMQERFHVEYHFLSHGKWKKIAVVTADVHLVMLLFAVSQFTQSHRNEKKFEHELL